MKMFGFGKVVCSLACLFIVVASARGEFRIWESITGQAVEAEYDTATDTQVYLYLRNGKRISVPLNKLSEADQKYVASRQADDRPLEKAGIAIYTPNASAETVVLLSKALASGEVDDEDVVSIQLTDITNQTAEVLVLYMPERLDAPFDEKTLAVLRERKIIGIGYGAAQLFGQMGLEINAANCVISQGDELKETYDCTKSPPGGWIGTWTKFDAYRFGKTMFNTVRSNKDFCFAMFLRLNDWQEKQIMALVRWDYEFAPIVKQGNDILVGLAAPPETWAKDYTKLLGVIAGDLVEQPKAAFSLLSHKFTKPGSYPFTLRERFSRNEYCFQIEKPTIFCAKLQQTGSRNLTFTFMGLDEMNGETNVICKNSTVKDGDELEIRAQITEEDIKRIGKGYWKLVVQNLDNKYSNTEVTCGLNVYYSALPMRPRRQYPDS